MKIDRENIKLDQLATHRRDMNLSAQAVADAIKVSRQVIRNIEKGHFEKIGAAPFVRGHVINYCKTLNLDASVVLAQIPGQVLAHQNVKRPDAFLPASVSKVHQQTRYLGRYVFGTTLLGVLGLSGYFIWDKWDLFQQPAEQIALVNDQQQVTYSSIIPPVQQPLSSQPETAETAVDTAVEEPEQDPAIEPADAQVDETVENTDNETQIDESQADSVEAMAGAPAFVIEFELQEEAWVSIKTESGDNVIHDLIGPGPRRYESDQPMNMRIGNADKLTMSINGELVDLQPHTNKNLAKLSWPSS